MRFLLNTHAASPGTRWRARRVKWDLKSGQLPSWSAHPEAEKRFDHEHLIDGIPQDPDATVAATEDSRENFGLENALGYLIGEHQTS